MIRIDPYLNSPLHRWVMSIVIAVYRGVSHGPFTPFDTGLRRRLLRITRSTSGRGSGSALMRAFAGFKPLPIRFISPSLC
ncbi:hypothetical protein M405DRAFT_334980 [Rhizopogon salebrosus TDB-379]|nr:hypothetical protein M405DRAFT_334980 [Rhizopogon salebrosus TDB-379]